MPQVLFYIVLITAGAIATFLLLRVRLKKISMALNAKVDHVRSVLSTGADKKIIDEKPSKGIFDELVSVGNKIDSINLKRPVNDPVIEKDNNEIVQKTEDLKKRYDNLQIVNELGQLVTSSLSLEDTFAHLYKTVNSLMDAAVFELGVYYRRENRWNILSNIEIGKDGNDAEENYRNQMAEWCLYNNREIFLTDAEKDYSRYVFKELTLPDGRIAQSVMSFPIFRFDKECGTITVISFRKNAFNEYHVEMLRSLLPYTAVALENALIHQELIATQDQLIHNEKMASIGQLVSGIAHEILNPLNFVNNFSKLSMEIINEIDQNLPANEQAELKTQLVGNLEKISFHGSRAYEIVRNMMMISRSGKGEKDAVDINNNIEEFYNISCQGFKIKSKEFNCDVEYSLDSTVPKIVMIPQDFGRVLINLFNNAFYAMNDKWKKLQAANNLLPDSFQPLLKIKSSVMNSRVIITINDNGTGIPEEIKNKVFLPFFTTKPAGEGTGLGLSLSHDIIHKGNRGELTFKTELGKWTEFRIELPVSDPNFTNRPE